MMLNAWLRTVLELTPKRLATQMLSRPRPTTPATHDQPEQDSRGLLPPSGNTTSTVVSPGATALALMKSESARLLNPHETAGQKIDSSHPNHPDPPDLAAARLSL
jgi:hypothetical protein